MIYEIIGKILINRMRPLLVNLIDPTQSAFVSNRSIHDNILLAHEVINKFNNMKGKKSWVALKLDMCWVSWHQIQESARWDCARRYGRVRAKKQSVKGRQKNFTGVPCHVGWSCHATLERGFVLVARVCFGVQYTWRLGFFSIGKTLDF